MSQQIQRDALDAAPQPGFGSTRDQTPPGPREIELSAAERADLAERLTKNLARTYSLFLRTVGPIYYNLEQLTRQEYEALIPAIDDTAECIREIGRPFRTRFAPDSTPAAEYEDPASTSQRDERHNAAEGALAIAPFAQNLRAALGVPAVPVESENGRSIRFRS